MRPLLAPGVHVLRRTDNRLQIGFDRARAITLPDTPALRHDLRLLERGELAGTSTLPGELQPLLRSPARRRAGKVAVTGFGHPAGAMLPARLRELVGQSGLSSGRSAADVAVVAGAGEPDRGLVDRWTQVGAAHVLVRLVEGHAVVGPFVVPGRTACLRCVDAAATDVDPSWPLLLEQYTSLSARDRHDGLGEPVDPVLAHLACAWALRDVATYLEGHRPSTWSATIRLDPLLHDVAVTEWLRHPACGCTWTTETMSE